jgi:FkbM family methyltransferase
VSAQADLVFDVGFHRGEDTEFYLKRGFRVIGVEANPELCASARDRFRDPIREGRLKLVNKAVARRAGKLVFHVNEQNSVWGTLDPLWAERNARRGAASRPVTVEATTMGALIAEFGVPHFAKFDIEGFDMVGVEGLAASAVRPAYVSVESEKDSFKTLRHEFDVLTGLGYDRFKVVPQSCIPGRRAPGLDHVFPEHASGPFGEEAPGDWLTADEAIEVYKPIFVRYALVGDDPIAPRWLRSAAWRLGVRADWYDTHAKLAGAARSGASADGGAA